MPLAGRPGRPDNGRMRIRPRALLDGTGWAIGLAAVLFAVSLVFVILTAQSPQAVLWTGQHAVGTEQNGLVYFTWQGRTYSTTVPGYGSARSVDVYFDPGNPLNAMAGNLADRVITGLLVAGPAAAGIAVLAIGLTRKRRWQRRRRREAAAAGGAGDDEVFSKLLAQRRGEHPSHPTR